VYTGFLLKGQGSKSTPATLSSRGDVAQLELRVMATSGLRGSFPLTNQGIDSEIKRISAGAYALGHVNENIFYITYIGRSDDDVGDRLKDHVGSYKRFKYEYYGSSKQAFDKECNIYHDFSPADNKVHPARPKGSNWKCPNCKAFD
jgi:hypothetical protein